MLGKILNEEKARLKQGLWEAEGAEAKPDQAPTPPNADPDLTTPPHEGNGHKKDKNKTPKKQRLARHRDQTKLTNGTAN